MKSTNEIDTYIKMCIGLRVSDIWQGKASALFIELGKLHKHRDSRNHISKGQGDITLMFDCRWRLESKRSIVVGALDEELKIEHQIKKLLGEPVKSILFIGRIPEISVAFKNDHYVQSFCSFRSEDWGIIFRNSGSICRKNNRVIYERNHENVSPS
jgi:hypothetical protein